MASFHFPFSSECFQNVQQVGHVQWPLSLSLFLLFLDLDLDRSIALLLFLLLLLLLLLQFMLYLNAFYLPCLAFECYNHVVALP